MKISHINTLGTLSTVKYKSRGTSYRTKDDNSAQGTPDGLFVDYGSVGVISNQWKSPNMKKSANLIAKTGRCWLYTYEGKRKRKVRKGILVDVLSVTHTVCADGSDLVTIHFKK